MGEQLDFTGLYKIAYKGFDTAAAREKRDALIAEGYAIVDDKGNPFLQASGASGTPSEPPRSSGVLPPPPAPQKTTGGKSEPFTNASGTRNYKAIYRVAHDYHKRHNPPVVEREYWRTHPPGAPAPSSEVEYWNDSAEDIMNTAQANGNDAFLMALLAAVYEELEREYNQTKEAIAAGT